jgi:hypothetical protein
LSELLADGREYMLDDEPFAGQKIVHYFTSLDILYDSDQIIDIGLCRLNLIECYIYKSELQQAILNQIRVSR